MPTKIRMGGRKRKLPDFMNEFHMYCVNRRFIDVVETFQKDVQYFPVECLWADGSLAGEYFFFFTTVLLDAVNREKTTMPWLQVINGGIWDKSVPDAKEKIFVFDKSLIGDHHIWVDPHHMTNYGALVSEDLFKALKREKIQLFHESEYFEEV